MADADGRSSPHSPVIPQAPILTSFFDILIPFQGKLVVQNSQYHLMDFITPADWGVVQERARAVEKLHLTSPDEKEIASSTYFRLAQLQGNTPFFPALRTLQLNTPAGHKNPPVLFHLPLFLSPTLTSITISHLGQDAAGSLISFLLNNSAGPLASLILRSVELSPLLATSISQCRSLKILDLILIGLLEYSALQVILSCTWLLNVKFDARSTRYGGLQATHAITVEIAWDDIGQIRLEGQISMIEGILTATANRKMLGLAITLSGYHDQRTIQYLLQNIATQQPSIMNLTINLASPLVIDASFLNSLLSADTFHEFRRVEFRALAFAQLDQYLPQMLSHWQHIQHLSFGISVNAAIARYISLASLKSVAQSCPNLNSLEAPFDSPDRSFDAPGGMEDCFLSHKLLRLSLIAFDPNTSPYYNHEQISAEIAQRVAHYIYALFPDLDGIETHACHRHSHDYWKPVADSYKLFQCFCRREFKALNDMRQRQLDGAGD